MSGVSLPQFACYLSTGETGRQAGRQHDMLFYTLLFCLRFSKFECLMRTHH